jgi:hypothetical protein
MRLSVADDWDRQDTFARVIYSAVDKTVESEPPEYRRSLLVDVGVLEDSAYVTDPIELESFLNDFG